MRMKRIWFLISVYVINCFLPSGSGAQFKQQGSIIGNGESNLQSTKFEKWQTPNYFRGFDVTFWCAESDCNRTLPDIMDLKATGANLVQINVTQGIVFPASPYLTHEEGRASLDSMVSFCRQANLYYTIAVRVGPGRQDVAAEGEDGSPVSTIWTDHEEQILYGGMLTDIVQRYQSQTDTLFVGLNMIVEPNPFLVEFDMPATLDSAMAANSIDINQLYKMLIDSVRTEDPQLPLLVQSVFHSNPEFWGLLEKQEDPFIVYDFHTYEPFDYTHADFSNSQTYPGTYYNITENDDILYTKQFYADVVFAKVKSFEQNFNVPIFMGEFGMQFPQNGGIQYLKDLHSIAVDNGWHFALWSYRPDPDPAFLYFDYEKWDVLYWETILSFFTDQPVDVDQTSSTINLPETEHLFQNYPNPFNPVTTIRYSVSRPATVQLKIYDISAKLVIELVNEQKTAGDYSATWLGRNERGERVASGIYLYKLRVGDNLVSLKKMIMLK